MTEHAEVAREHGFHELRVAEIVEETPDTRTFVLDVPGDLTEVFAYRPGQFCTVRVRPDGDEALRCYSMSSAPGVDPALAITVKRVAGGLVSNWLHDHVEVGNVLELTKPAGQFCPGSVASPIVAYCGGSGVTPVYSIVKHVLATTDRPVNVLVANRDRASAIFHDGLARLSADHPDRLRLHLHHDDEAGYVDPVTVQGLITGTVDAEVFICGPTPFMDLVEQTLLDAGVDPQRIAIERFVAGGAPTAVDDRPGTPDGAPATTETLTIVLKGKTHRLAYTPGDTVLDAARRAGLKPPFSCELGNCATCMALVSEGSATMRVNNALTPAELAEGWVLTCQAIPAGPVVQLEYENL